MTRPLEELLGCFGYHGFGSGYALAKWGPAQDTGEMYCGRCASRDGCWQRHRARVRLLFPDLTALADEIAATHRGDAYMREFIQRTGQGKEQFAEPFITVMMGNMEDGAHIATTGRPKARKNLTLSWPLTPLGEIA